jgi:beta-lactamase superfamily II metal-dependent hydrolase
MAKMQAPENGVAVRMYRQGHGDCFLLAFPREGGGDPVYVLIDCGYKPGSQNFVHGKKIGDTVKHIGKATGNHLDLVIITHEHQDHVNGFWKKRKPYFEDFEIEEAWLAWTEDPADPLADELRERHKDQLLGLVQARHQLSEAVGADDLAVGRLDSFLSLEFGGESDKFNLQAMLAAAKDPSKSTNKQAMKLIKDKAFEKRGVRYLSPGGEPLDITSSAGVRAYVLGPPRSEDLLVDEDPVGSEGFPDQDSGAHGFSFSAAVRADPGEGAALFAEHYRSPVDNAFKNPFFRDHYGTKNDGGDDKDKIEAPPNAPWRRIDAEWLFSADSLALALNRGVNNTSLVLAFELPGTKKILLFAGDAQRGNWISWDDSTWVDSDQTITARDILGRTVLYKVGHHGSHNATLAGKANDDYPNLSWMGRDAFAGEFTAMITAVTEWALTKNNPPWRHPLPSIKEALEQKTQGRVFQTDEAEPVQPANVPDAVWNEFLARVTVDELFVDYIILDDRVY